MISNKHAEVGQIALKLPQIVCILTSFIFIMQINLFECGFLLVRKTVVQKLQTAKFKIF